MTHTHTHTHKQFEDPSPELQRAREKLEVEMLLEQVGVLFVRCALCVVWVSSSKALSGVATAAAREKLEVEML